MKQKIHTCNYKLEAEDDPADFIACGPRLVKIIKHPRGTWSKNSIGKVFKVIKATKENYFVALGPVGKSSMYGLLGTKYVVGTNEPVTEFHE